MVTFSSFVKEGRNPEKFSSPPQKKKEQLTTNMSCPSLFKHTDDIISSGSLSAESRHPAFRQTEYAKTQKCIITTKIMCVYSVYFYEV